MTSKTTVAPGSSFTVPAGISLCRVTARGAAGATPASGAAGGLGLILQDLWVVSASRVLAVAGIPGGTDGSGAYPGGAGGMGVVVDGLMFAPGGGGGGGSGVGPGSGGNAGLAAGNDGSRGLIFPSGDALGGKGASGSTGGAAGGTGATAGKDRSAGGAGGNGGSGVSSAAGSGGGGGGFAGGGGGMRSSGQGGSGGGGGGGSGSGGSAVGFNESTTASADFEVAATPLTPTLIGPSGAQMVDRTIDQALTWQPNPASADVLDAIVANDVQYRKIGTSTWTTATVDATGAYTIAAGTLEAGAQYEWQARSTADGLIGPWSTSSYFTADNPATAPIPTSPAADAVIGVNSITAAWAVGTQTSYQMRVVGDDNGSPATGTIYADSGEQVSTDRTKTLTLGINHVAAHVQVRVRNKTSGVWSAWASVAVTIEWAGPPKPRVTLATDVRSIHITVTNPDPVGVEPVADRIEVYVIERDIRQRRAILAPGDGWIYETPPSGVDVGIEAVAIYTPTNVMTSSGVIY